MWTGTRSIGEGPSFHGARADFKRSPRVTVPGSARREIRRDAGGRPEASDLVQDEFLDVAGEHDERPCIVDTFSLLLDTGEESRLAQAAWGSPAEPRNPNLMIGNTVGHYRITARLGAGGMGEVFLAEDIRLDRKAAIKFLPADLADDPDRRRRFLTEAKAASALNHPHVCVVYDVGETEDGLPFIAMEFVEGQSLGDLVKQELPEISRVAPAWIMAILFSDTIAAGLARSGEIRFEPESGLSELRAEWHNLTKRVIPL